VTLELRFLLFLAVMITLVVAGHVYFYRRLVRDTVESRRGRWVGMGIIGLLGALLIFGGFLRALWPGTFSQRVNEVGFVWMGLSLFLILALFAFGAARWVDTRVRARGAQKAAEVDGQRRLFLSRSVAGGAAVVAGTVGGYGAWRAYQPPVVTELAVKLRGLPRALDGLSIVHLTDIHVGNLIERRFMDDLVRRANALRPDLVAVTGDLVDGGVPELGPAVAALSDLRSRFGTFFCTGNHEYYSGDLAWTAFLESIGVTVLRNRHVQVGDAGGSLDLVGVDDWSMQDSARGYDLDRAVAGRDRDRGAVLLAHQPANFEGAVDKGIGLQLSGHTHGGQLFPFTFLVGLQWAHVAGHYTHRDGHLYVGRGCGFWGPPMRVGSPPELVNVVLTA
jgi:predicted MPP superfamily phosphohydrolase